MIGTMHELNKSGDTKIVWDSENRKEIAAARKTYNDLKKQGFTAYSVKDSGKRKEIVHTFDPYAEKIILVPPMAGG